MGETPRKSCDRLAIDEQAAAYVARLACGVTPAERQEIYGWVAADPHHAVAFARMESAWEGSERLRAAPPALEAHPEPSGALPRPGRRQLMIGGLAAASAAVAATVGWRLLDNVELHRTRVGERGVVALKDGSRVTLNTASTVEVAFTASERRVRLVRGEALFEVAHDAARPFLVDAGAARFRALGTAFNVRLRPDVVELTVTQGVVGVVAKQGEVDVPAAARIVAGGGAVVRSGAVAATALDGQHLRQRIAWQEGVLEFDGESLAQAVAEFNRYRRQPIVIGDARLEALRIGGRFEVDEADKFLAALTGAFSIDVIATTDGGVLLVERPSS
ncbi:FecR domain-containing protein [Phenylobacterium sp.]|uniref:FecR family protein n=1 Tax=Phenylobacterium sp. TaxID=1871053 RepID=UPI0025F742FB|nr:FecR domain-containing protein [Phenylobacterium sp.]